MKTIAFAILALLTAVSDSDGQDSKTEEPKVSVCVDKSLDATARLEDEVQIVGEAEWIVTKMFSGVGIRIEWHGYPRSCQIGSDQPIIIKIGLHTPKTYFPGALGFALPYEGIHIRVFYDRVQTVVQKAGVAQPGRVADLLAHVLAHEITHVLQVSNSHTEVGIMKARWSSQDYAQMRRTPFAFTEYDVMLIRLGFEVRKSRLATGFVDPANSTLTAFVLQ